MGFDSWDADQFAVCVTMVVKQPKDQDYSLEGWKAWLSSPEKIREHINDYPFLWGSYAVGFSAKITFRCGIEVLPRFGS